MMILPDKVIRDLKISPMAMGIKRPGVISYGLSSYGYDIRAGYVFRIFTNVNTAIVDPKQFDEKAFVCVDVSSRPDKWILIPPNSFALAESVEEFQIPRDCLALVIGKSTYARCGIVLNCTPLEPEWRGKITLEISNTTPLPAKIYAGEGVGQVLFFRAEAECETSYADKNGKYQGQQGIEPPKVDI